MVTWNETFLLIHEDFNPLKKIGACKYVVLKQNESDAGVASGAGGGWSFPLFPRYRSSSPSSLFALADKEGV